jgi:DNA repair protein RadC
MSTRIQDLPENDRPRERLLKLGPSALTNAELIALFINTGVKGENAIQMANRLLRDFVSLRNLSRRNANEIADRFRGLGPAKTALIAAAFELGRRATQEELISIPMDSPSLIYRYLGADMARLGHETLRILILDTKMCLIHDQVIFEGTLNELQCHPREIMHAAIVNRGQAFILAHNHPSGDPSPSDADRRFTRRIKEVAETMQIPLLDHVIIGFPRDGAQPYFSFKEFGVL